MAKLLPTDIVQYVRAALCGASTGKSRGRYRGFMTAYQIFNELPQHIRSKLVEERRRGGKGSGKYFAAPHVVTQAAQMLCRAHKSTFLMEYLDTKGITITDSKSKQPIVPSYKYLCAIYRCVS
jgi:hypothetical protein